MLRTLAVAAVTPVMIVLAVPANAVPNYAVFLQAIAGDGIVLDPREAILEGQAVCKLMEPPDGGSLWDAGQQVRSKYTDWRMDKALNFANRSVQNICPNRGSF